MKKRVLFPLICLCCFLFMNCRVYADPVAVEDLPEKFIFASGSGGWSTDLTILDRWAFAGSFHDSDLGEVGDGYPNGTVSICDFTGFLSEPEQIAPYAFKFNVLSMTQKQKEGEAEIRDGIRYVGATPYGLEGCDELILYLPGTPVSELTEDCMFWVHVFLGFEEPEYLPEEFYVLYNVEEEYAFVGEKNSY